MPKCEKCDEDMKLIDRYDVSIGSNGLGVAPDFYMYKTDGTKAALINGTDGRI